MKNKCKLTKTQLKKELKNIIPKMSIKLFLEMLGKNSRSLSRYSADEELPRIYWLELFYLKNKDVAKKYIILKETLNNIENKDEKEV